MAPNHAPSLRKWLSLHRGLTAFTPNEPQRGRRLCRLCDKSQDTSIRYFYPECLRQQQLPFFFINAFNWPGACNYTKGCDGGVSEVAASFESVQTQEVSMHSDFERFVTDLSRDTNLLEYVRKNVTGLASLVATGKTHCYDSQSMRLRIT